MSQTEGLKVNLLLSIVILLKPVFFFSNSRCSAVGSYWYSRPVHSKNQCRGADNEQEHCRTVRQSKQDKSFFRRSQSQEARAHGRALLACRRTQGQRSWVPANNYFLLYTDRHSQSCHLVTNEARWFCILPHLLLERENIVCMVYTIPLHEKTIRHVCKGFKGKLCNKVVLATTALSIGVNFHSIRRFVMFGPPRSILDFHQEAGQRQQALSGDHRLPWPTDNTLRRRH